MKKYATEYNKCTYTDIVNSSWTCPITFLKNYQNDLCIVCKQAGRWWEHTYITNPYDLHDMVSYSKLHCDSAHLFD